MGNPYIYLGLLSGGQGEGGLNDHLLGQEVAGDLSCVKVSNNGTKVRVAIPV